MYSKKRKSQKTGRSTGDKAVDRIISDVYNEINKLNDSVKSSYKSDIDTRDGNPGDIRIVQDKSFDSNPREDKREFYIEAKTEDGWVRQVMDRTDHSGISRKGTVPLSSLKFDAKSAIKQGELSFWKVDSKPVFTPKSAFSQGIEVYINENVKIGQNAAKNLEVTGTLKLATPADGDASAENILVHDTGDGLVKKRSYAQILSDLGISADEIIDWTTDQGSTNIHANNIVITHNQVTDFDSEVNALAQVKIDALIDSAPGALNTLNELAAALNDDASFATTVTNSIATKVGLTGDETVAGVKTFSSSIDLTGVSSDPGDDNTVRIGATSGYDTEIFQINSNDGWVKIGPYNESYCHFVTDRPMFYFNQDIAVDTGLISSFNEDLVIRRVFNDTSYNQITLGDDSFELKLDNTARLSVDGDGNTTLAGDLTINSPESKLIFRGDDTSENHEIESDGNLYITVDDDADDTNNFLQFRAHSGGTLKNIMKLQDDGQVGIGVTDPDSRLEVKGAGNDNSTHAFYVKNSSDTNLFYVRDDGVVSILGGYLFAQHSNGAYFTGSIKARGGITDDAGALGLGGNGNTDDMTISSGKVAIGTATGSPNMQLEVVAGENDGILINRNATTTGSPVEVGFRHTTSAGDAATGMRSYRTNEDDSYDQELRFFTTAGSGGQAEHLTIKHNGKIGMGTSTPDANLQIHSTSGTKLWLTANGGNPADAASLRFAESENGANYIQLSYDGSANTLSVDSNNNNDMTVWDRVNNRMTNNAYVWNYRTSFPQVKYSQNGSDFVEKGLSGNIFYNKTSSANVDFKWRDNLNADLLTIDTGGKTLTIAEGAQTTFRLKIGNNGRMNMPMQGPEFEGDHGYFAPLGTMFLPLFINATQSDLIRFQTPLTFEYWDYSSSAWVDDSSNVANLKKLLDGRRSTSHSLTNTKRKFRFVIERVSTWAEDQLYYIENTWSSIGTWSTSAAGGGSLTPTMQVERLDGTFDASNDSNNDWTTNAGFTTDWHTTGIWNNFGLAMFYVTDQHNEEKHIRITVTFPEYGDTSKTISLKNIGVMSSYSSVNTNQQAWTQTFDRYATSASNVNVTGNLSVGDAVNSGSEFHVKNTSSNARARIETDATNGVAYLRLENDAQNWDIRVDGGNSDKFIIRDETGSTNRFLMDTSGNINTTGNIVPAGYLQLTGAPSDPGADNTVRLGEETNVLKIFSNYGYIRLGAESASWAHIRTDRSQFYFDKKIVVDEGIVSSYDEDLILRRDYNDTTYNQITIGDDTLDIKLDNTSRLAIDGNGQVDLTGDLVLRGEKGIFIENLGGPTGTSTGYGGSIIQPATAMYRTATNAHTGFIKIVIPTSTGEHPRDMFTFWVDVFDYASGDSFSVYISGYNYQDVGSNEWHNCDAMILGTESHRDFTVRFCHDNTNPCITIGETDTTWNYLQVTVRNVQVGFTADIDDFKGDWTITVETTLPSVVDETVSGNFPIAKRTIGTADIATTVTLTDQGSDSTCFPVFSTANTGDRNLHTDSSALTYNSTNGTLTSTTVSATNLVATNKLNITTTSDAVATFTMTDDAWGYMEWKNSETDGTERQAYMGMDSDMNRFLLTTENDTTEVEINTTTVDINADVDISGNITLAGQKYIQFASADTRIYTNSDATEDLYIESDDDIYIRADDNLVIAHGTTNYVTFKGDERQVDITGDLIVSADLLLSGNITSGAITSGFGNINIGSSTLDAGATTLSVLEVGDSDEGIKLLNISSNISGIYGVDTGGAGWNSIHIKADGNDGLFIEKDTNKVGIGKTNPSEMLDVTGNAEVSGNVTAGNLISAGYVDLTSNTNATDYSGDTGTIRTEGGASIARDVYVGGNMGVLGEITSGAVVWESFPFIANLISAGRYHYRDVDDVEDFRVWDDYDTDPTGFSYLDVPGQYVVPEDCTLKAMRAVVTNFTSTTNVTLTIYHGTPNLDTTSDTTLAVAGTATTITIDSFRRAYAGSATYDVDLDAGDIVVPTVSHANAGASQLIRGNITLKFVTR